MEKVIKFLESYVQWVAMGIAVLWIAWVGYAYWLTPSTSVEVAGQRLEPGKVDEFVAAAVLAFDQAVFAGQFLSVDAGGHLKADAPRP